MRLAKHVLILGSLVGVFGLGPISRPAFAEGAKHCEKCHDGKDKKAHADCGKTCPDCKSKKGCAKCEHSKDGKSCEKCEKCHEAEKATENKADNKPTEAGKPSNGTKDVEGKAPGKT